MERGSWTTGARARSLGGVESRASWKCQCLRVASRNMAEFAAMIHKPPSLVLLLILVVGTLGAQAPSDRDVLGKIQTEGLQRSQVAPVFEMLTVNIGPRLTASPAHKRAAEWMRDRLASYGLSNVHLEPWHFGRGWELQR